MKSILKLAAAFLIGFAIFFSCKKEATTKDNQLPPVADAGPDQNVSIAACAAGNTVDLDGSHSSDPDNNITSYFWTKISGPSVTISNPRAPKPRLSNFFPAHYAFELKVTDAGGLSSNDTVLINITGPGRDVDLDLTINANYIFYDNYEDCYYGPPCYYYDQITIQNTFDSQPIGQLTFYAQEFSDTAISGLINYSNASLYNVDNSAVIGGTCSVNLKQLIEHGGGPFSGTWKITGGSGQSCSQTIYDNLAPLAFTGSLDTTTKSLTIKIQGKTYF